MANEVKYLFLCKEKEDGDDIVKGVYDSLDAANKAALKLFHRLTYNAQQTQRLFTVSVKSEWLENEDDWESYRIYDLPRYRFDSKRKFTVSGDHVQDFYEDIPQDIVDEYQNRGLNDAEVFELVNEWNMSLEEIMDMLDEADIEALEKAEKIIFYKEPDNTEQPYSYRCIRCETILAPSELESMSDPRCPKCRCLFSTETLHEAKDEYIRGVEDEVKGLSADLEDAARDQASLKAETDTRIAELNAELYEAWTEANKGFFARLKDLFTGKRKENREKMEAMRITVEEAGKIGTSADVSDTAKEDTAGAGGTEPAGAAVLPEADTNAPADGTAEEAAAPPEQEPAGTSESADDDRETRETGAGGATDTDGAATDAGPGSDATDADPGTEETTAPAGSSESAEAVEQAKQAGNAAKSADPEPVKSADPAAAAEPSKEAAAKERPMTEAERKRAEEDAIIEEKVRQLKEMKAKQAAKMAEAKKEAEMESQSENSGSAGSFGIADMLKSTGAPDVSDVFKTAGSGEPADTQAPGRD